MSGEELTHSPCIPLDPAGTMPRRWKCLACDRIGASIGDLNATECPSPILGPAALSLVAIFHQGAARGGTTEG